MHSVAQIRSEAGNAAKQGVEKVMIVVADDDR